MNTRYANAANLSTINASLANSLNLYRLFSSTVFWCCVSRHSSKMATICAKVQYLERTRRRVNHGAATLSVLLLFIIYSNFNRNNLCKTSRGSTGHTAVRYFSLRPDFSIPFAWALECKGTLPPCGGAHNQLGKTTPEGGWEAHVKVGCSLR